MESLKPLKFLTTLKRMIRPSEYRDWSESLTITINGTADLTKLEFESDGMHGLKFY